MPVVDVLGSTMYFEDEGSGTPHVLLHGNPASSHLWRKVLPLVGGRRLAPDLIGMGRSGKPDIPYRFDDHARYLDAWFDALDLDEVVLVGIDWGGALAFDWAARNPTRVRGIAFMETILKPMSRAEFPAAAWDRFQALKDAEFDADLARGFLEQALANTVLTGLSEEDADVYRAPFLTPESRRPLLEWPRAMPLEGRPADVVARVEEYDKWLMTSTDVPKLLLTFDTSPTLMVREVLTKWCVDNIAALETVHCGPAGHLAPEDQPEAIAAAINAWSR
ncbi:haloalkane dehalogenase [Allokutzneria sp. A3M-2-11 16]|uniref:haloalkane dehalogenase n=1 Tax=Allokutzneria sp. A3M-2-11 16 TaxID=2962043 RepID=UPI0020B7B13F|nr:haloalkane dehalogenase [Allokutzneria sp. A3M-2-11 16]